MNIVLKCMAALGLLTLMAGSSHAMAEYAFDTILPDGKGCWNATDENYGVNGSTKGKQFLIVRMLPTKEYAAIGPMHAAGYLNARPKVFDPTTGKDVGEYKGINDKGYAVFWIPKKATFQVIYYSNYDRRETYEGWFETCLNKGT